MGAFFEDYLERMHTLCEDFAATFADLPDESLDWQPGPDMNSLTVLVAHTTGSARYWIGDVGLGEPSNRNRAAEFETTGLSTSELVARLSALEDYVRAAVPRLEAADLTQNAIVTNKAMDRQQCTVGWALLHALEHTALHLGHAQITRQLWQQRQ